MTTTRGVGGAVGGGLTGWTTVDVGAGGRTSEGITAACIPGVTSSSAAPAAMAVTMPKAAVALIPARAILALTAA